MTVTYDLVCPISGEPLGHATFQSALSDSQQVALQSGHVSSIVGELLNAAGISIDDAMAAQMDLAALQLAAARAGVQSQLDAWLAQKYGTPIVVNGISLPIDTASQDSLTRLFVADSGLVQMGAAQPTDTTGLADSNGEWQTMTYAAFFALVPGYVATCKALAQTYATAASQIKAAPDVATLNAITWG